MTRSITVLFVLIASIALVTADLVVSAQNTNSSTTQNANDEQTRGGMMTTQNDNTPRTGGRRRRRGRRRSTTADTSGDMSGNANMADDTSGNANMAGDTSGNANMTGDMSGNMGGGGRGRRRRRGRRRAANMDMPAGDTSGGMQTGATERTDGGTQEDWAGQSYTGTINYPDGNMTGTATLAFESGNQFTLTPEGGTATSGRYAAVTTRGYTGVTMMFTGATPPAIVSVRLRKMGNGISIMSVPGESHQFSFTSSGGGGGMTRAGGGRRRRRPRRMRPRRGGIKPPMNSPDTTPTPTP